ncbi:C4-dicarboxylate ABC transporter [Candidatus Parcubacteria bacterium]|nr:MAG: C4-dicarboxylate ABC transporter [Candidatus Parcubacteria bacterium]
MKNIYRIKNFPVSFFSVVMGLGGLSIVVQKMVEIFSLCNFWIEVSAIFTLSIFLIIAAFYSRKAVFHFKEVKKEFRHPIKINFFPTIAISLLLLSVIFLEINVVFAKYLWLFGTGLQLIFALMIISAWINQRHFDIKHINPSWFIPAVGNILVPIAGIQFVANDILWLFFSAGLFFWIILMPVFFNRMFFFDQLPEKLLPTLFILLAPPAIGFVSYVKLTGNFNDFARTLYFFGMFLSLLLLLQIKYLSKIKFYLSWWAYSFPIAALAVSNALMYKLSTNIFYKYLLLTLFIILLLLVVFLTLRTIKAITRKEICIEE